jgi:hypothetical protein
MDPTLAWVRPATATVLAPPGSDWAAELLFAAAEDVTRTAGFRSDGGRIIPSSRLVTAPQSIRGFQHLAC